MSLADPQRGHRTATVINSAKAAGPDLAVSLLRTLPVGDYIAERDALVAEGDASETIVQAYNDAIAALGQQE
jgi:hypothetical protein